MKKQEFDILKKALPKISREDLTLIKEEIEKILRGSKK